MSIRVFAASMGFLDIPPSSGSLRVPWSQRSEFLLVNFCLFRPSFYSCNILVYLLSNVYILPAGGNHAVLEQSIALSK